MLFIYLNSFIGGNKFVDEVILFFARDYLYILILIILVWLVLLYGENFQKWKEALTRIVTTLITLYIVTTLIRHYYHHLRPFLALKTAHLFEVTSYSFPSGHTISIIGLATAIYFYNKKLGYFVFISGVLVGIARVMAGVHYPLDILGGIILGTLIGVGVHWSYEYART